MTRLLTLTVALAPGAALAHGGHAPVVAELHQATHLWPYALIGAGVALGLIAWGRICK